MIKKHINRITVISAIAFITLFSAKAKAQVIVGADSAASSDLYNYYWYQWSDSSYALVEGSYWYTSEDSTPHYFNVAGNINELNTPSGDGGEYGVRFTSTGTKTIYVYYGGSSNPYAFVSKEITIY